MKILKFLDLFIYGFFGLFFIYYIGKFGISNLIIEGNTKSKILLNIGIWLILITICIDKVLDAIEGSK